MVGYLSLIFFGSSDLLTHHCKIPKVKVNKSPRRKRYFRRPSGPKQHPSFRHIFASSHHDNEEDDSSDDEGLSFKDNNDSENDSCGAENEEEENITPDGRIPIISQVFSLPSRKNA